MFIESYQNRKSEILGQGAPPEPRRLRSPAGLVGASRLAECVLLGGDAPGATLSARFGALPVGFLGIPRIASTS